VALVCVDLRSEGGWIFSAACLGFLEFGKVFDLVQYRIGS
jgi:hypothetical protein